MIRLTTYLFLVLLLPGLHVCAQSEIPQDTTYTVWSTHQKLKKQYPTIQVVQPFQLPQIEQKIDVSYVTVPYTTGERSLKADLFYPRKHKQKLPAVVLVHGGGWRSGNKSMNTPLAQQLASNGYFVMSVEYQLSLEAKYPAAIHNLKAAVRWLRKHAKELNVNENFVAMVGGSAGGQLASFIGATNGDAAFEGQHGYAEFSSAVQAVIDLDGLLDFTDSENQVIKRTAYSADVFWLQGTYDSIPDRWREASPLFHVTEKSPSYLFINSSQTRFHAGCKTMVDKLASFNIESQVVTFSDAPHSYWFFEPWFSPMVNHIVLFLNRTRKNYPQ